MPHMLITYLTALWRKMVSKQHSLVKDIKDKKGVLLVPAFAVGRAQLLLHYFYTLFKQNPTLQIPVYINSPMTTLNFLVTIILRIKESSTLGVKIRNLTWRKHLNC